MNKVMPKIYTAEMMRALGVGYTSNLNQTLKDVLKKLDPSGSESYRNWSLAWNLPINADDYDECCCGHLIKNTYFARHNTTGDIITVGCDCIDKFDTDMKQKRRHMVGTLAHGYVYCKCCNKKVSNGSEYHKTCFDRLPYKCVYCSEVLTNKKKASHLKREHKQAMYDDEKIPCDHCIYKLSRKRMPRHCHKHHIREVAKAFILKFGKYKGYSMKYAYKNDSNYVKWISKTFDDGLIKLYAEAVLTPKNTID
jgi:hypothetical protein